LSRLRGSNDCSNITLVLKVRNRVRISLSSAGLDVFLNKFPAELISIIRRYGCIANSRFAALRERHNGEYEDVLKFAGK